ncbi:DNA alkylation repair protein [Peribacillus loiseleuriae]|uniref:DNA alkylation repair protein n=1 Tax=Peribacillus loiseleuriae TaxID=1679170 RepID=A0A0K9GX52_9BACI|nr:DNA alkylation repair protein [Peribacillus loiseleuriae]KMY51274.1 DNA alkylation repair protein [Peribacillus loiseleuriae]
MDFYIQKLEKLYSENAEAEYAKWSKKYMRNQFDFLGIRTPIRRNLTKQFLKEYGLPSKEELETVILTLWEKPEREYQKAALDILEKTKKNLTPDDMRWLVSLLKSKSWWDTIDVLSPHIMGYIFLQYPHLIPLYPDQWIEDDYIWLQRSAILYQLYYKEHVNEKRLYDYILRQAHSNEFFVQKAIGWVLREYAKTNASSVQLFVSQNQLKPLSKREALKHLS